MARNCASCANVEMFKDEDTCGTDILRCAAPVPFWVPTVVHDYRSWVKPTDGEKCIMYSLRATEAVPAPQGVEAEF